MKKLVAILSVAMFLGVFSAQAQEKKQEVKKAPKTEQTSKNHKHHTKSNSKQAHKK
jgi:hypothetical protein